VSSTDVAALLGRLETFRGKACQITELHGGLTNRNYKVVANGTAYVVRLSPAGGPNALMIDRDQEYQNSVLAALSGAGAQVVEYVPGAGVLVIEYLEGKTLSDADFAARGTIPRIAAACRQLHSGPRFSNDFDMFEVQREYLRVVQGANYRVPHGYTSYADQVEEVGQALRVRAERTVPCNNDLLAANFIDTGDRIRLIDFEYSGNNDACFELGNIWSECHLSCEQLDELVTAYYGRTLRNKLARARLYGLMSRYGWTLWACIQHATSPIDFDFWSWGLEKYEAAVDTFRSPELEQLLEDVRCAD
jgi:thiamine kinase-like enzyme